MDHTITLPPRLSRRRPAFTLTEVTVALVLTGAVLGVVVPLTRQANEQSRKTAARRVALSEVSNVLEGLLVDRDGRPAAGEARPTAVPEVVARNFPDARLVVETVALDDPPGVRLDAALTWREATGGRSAPLRLSAFAFDEGAAR